MQSSANKRHGDDKLSEMSFNSPNTLPCGSVLGLLHQSVWKRSLHILHVECVLINKSEIQFKKISSNSIVLLAIEGVKLYQKPY